MVEMDKEVLKSYKKAGKIAAEVRDHGKQIAKPGTKLLDITEELEKMIKDKGAEIAFPVNVSKNDIAAHYTPYKGDKTKIAKADIVKIDVGVHVNGYIGDTAVTIGPNKKLIKASRDALDAALKMCTPGTDVNEIGKKIEEIITKAEFKPIENLTGHGLDSYDLHAEPQIPNVADKDSYELKENQVIAIEPFATNGKGRVKEDEPTVIFMMLRELPVRNKNARQIISYAKERMGLPFAERWVPLKRISTKLGMRELTMKGSVYEYPVLREVNGGLISQAEHTVIVKDNPIITTQLDKQEKG